MRVKNRDAFIDAMGRKEIYCGIHYPIPVHLQEAYRSLELGRGSFPVAEKCASEYVSLPMFPELKPEEIEYTASAIKEILG